MNESSRYGRLLKLIFTVAVCLAVFCFAVGCTSTQEKQAAVSHAPMTEELIDLVESDGQFAALLEESDAKGIG